MKLFLILLAVILLAAHAHIDVTVAGRTALSVPVSLIITTILGMLAYATLGRVARRVRHALSW